MKALVFGAGGQLGTELVHLLGSESALSRVQGDITDAGAVESVIARRRPEVVFNCAAYNAVDRAETERDRAFAVNAEGPGNLALACRRHGSSLVHFSTNFVFDGDQDQPYVEADEPNPLSAYGASKLGGERTALEVGARVLIVRTAAVYGGPHSFPQRIIQAAGSGITLQVVSDQRVNPTYARDLAVAAVALAEAGVSGIVHAVADGCCAWDELARAALEETGISVRVHGVPTRDRPAAARRPLNGCLASTRIPPLRPWREALHEALNP